MTSQIEELLRVLEIGAAGVVATIAAYLLGLYRVDLLMVIYFSITLAGQCVTALLAKMRCGTPPHGSVLRD
jgi:hypothetical protein